MADWPETASFVDRATNHATFMDAMKSQSGFDQRELSARARELEEECLYKSRSRDEYLNLVSLAKASLISKEGSDHNLAATTGVSEQPDALVQDMASSQVIYHAKSLNSTVYRLHKPAVRPDSDALVALKIVRLSSQQAPHDVVKETQVMRRLGNHHPYIMPLLGSGEMAGGLYVLRMPYMRYDLSSIARQNVLSANQKQFLLHNMFSGLAAVHRMGIIHRDIKPSNILLHHISGPAYLSDFGISWHEAINTEEAANNKITDVGTGCYRAPELLFGCRSYGAGLDMWAAGCTMAEVLVGGGKTLFDAGPTSREDFLGSDLGLIGSMFRTRGTPTDETWPEAKTFRDWGKISFKDYPALPWPEILPGVNIGGRDVVAGLVVYESADRSSAEGVLKQPYFQAYDAAGH